VRLDLLFGDAKFSICARIVKDVDVIPYMAVFLFAELGVNVQSNVQRLVSLRDVDRAIIELESVGSVIPVRTMAAPSVYSFDLD
jgi:hypothetical protein